jgi:UrcA family protein
MYANPIVTTAKRLIMSIVALVVVAVVHGLGSTACAGENVGDSRSALVSLADLDLSTAQGVETARGRIRQAARGLCAKSADRNDRSGRENFIACVESAIARVAPMLEALARTSATSHVANNSGE